MVPLDRTMVVSYRLSIVTIALSLTIRLQFAIGCLRHSNQQVWVSLGQNLCRRDWPCKPNFETIWERQAVVVCTRNRVDIFCRLSTMPERDRQTNRQTDYVKSTLIEIGEIAFSHVA